MPFVQPRLVRSRLAHFDVAIDHRFSFRDGRNHEQMGLALFLNKFQIDAFGQYSVPQQEGIGIERLICPDGYEQGIDPSEGDPGYI